MLPSLSTIKHGYLHPVSTLIPATGGDRILYVTVLCVTVPYWTSCRVALSVVLMLNMAMLYFLRVNISVAIICMVKEPTHAPNGNYSMSPANSTLTNYKFDNEDASSGNVCEGFFVTQCG